MMSLLQLHGLVSPQFIGDTDSTGRAWQWDLFSAKPEPNKQDWLTCCTYTNPDVNVLRSKLLCSTFSLNQMTVCM